MTATLTPTVRAVRATPRTARFGKGLAGAAAACLLWETVRAVGLINPDHLPDLADIASALGTGFTSGELLPALVATLWAWFLGLFVATLVGVGAGIALGLSRAADIVVRPIVEFLRPIPSVALIPIALMTIGLGLDMQVALTAFASVWPVLFSVKAGVEDTDPRYLDTGRVIGLRRSEAIVRIVLPNALPSLATGVRTAAAIALVLAITVEMVTGQPGLGAVLTDNRLAGRSAEVWATVFLTGVLGYVVNAIFLLIEKRVFAWSSEHRGS
ncbi:ABC transporter permease subunit [Microbacterium sp. MEC084]|uniref:ABC transporter permease n=1 Tax=Microbacterium sp. MEC084 TaxID=1963027 RepID=UPI00106FE63B|nr:ABC transporter permease [Microbacterium sp. MEC084]MCD1269947.1 ABC transporter permease subunit [Microbacterium sp. MEC084]